MGILARKGALWDTYKRHFGPEGDPHILVAKGATRDFNPEVSQADVDRAIERDPAKNRAEYLAEFRTDVEGFVTQEAVQACVSPGVCERRPEYKHSYVAFVDPSGGSADAFTLAIAHKEGSTQILDAIREMRPPFSPESVVDEYASLIKKYRCSQCFGDRYAGDWPAEQFRKRDVHLEPAEKTKSELYQDLLPLLNSRAVDLLDHGRLMMQLVSLERTTARGGRDKIDHPRGMHDDVANAVAGALVLAYEETGVSPAQRMRDNVKLAAAYKRMARSIA